MRFLKLHIAIVFLLCLASIANAQTPPELVDFDVIPEDGSEPPTAGVATNNNDVIIELVFDTTMDPNIQPGIRLGLRNSMLSALNFSNSVWNGKVWQGTFTVTKNLPATPDGEYVFEIFGARNIIGTEMQPTSSLDIGATDSTLFICRSGRLELSTTTLDFDTVAFGRDKILSFKVSNTSCTSLRVNSIVVPSPFSLYQSPSQFQVPPGSDITVSIRYNPPARASNTGTIIINSDDIFQAAHFVEAIGAAAGPQIRIAPTSTLDFGTLEIGVDSARTMHIINERAPQDDFSRPLEVGSLVINTEAFFADTADFIVQPGDTQNVKVTFAPQVRGRYNNTLQLSNNDLQNPVAVVFLNARGGEDSEPQKPVDLEITYDTFDRFIANPSFEVCWENPADPVGLTELWWKFGQENQPPVNATDTTGFGGRYAFGEETCATIQLAGNISPGLWYGWFWLVDAEGNSGVENYTTRLFYYDPTAPAAPIIVGRSIPEEQWFGSGDDFEITIRIPGDPVTGHPDANQVRWKYKTAPNTGRDFDDRYFFTEDDGFEVTFEVPFKLNSLCGQDELYIWLADSAGNVDHLAVTEVPYRFDICSGFVTEFEVTWPNFQGHTNQSSLPICWTPAQGAEEIREIWWKFTQTPAPPQNSSDTTSFGGKMTVSGGTSCINLPLTGLSSSHWYAYVWATLANGSSASYANPIAVNFSYDVEPPPAPQITGNSIPATAWIAAPDTFDITVNLPVASGETTTDVSELRWKFKSPPVTGNDYVDRFVFSSGSGLSRTVPIPFDSPEYCGDDLLYLWFADSAGNSSLSNVAGVRYRLDICAPEITPLVSKSSRTVLSGEAFSDTLMIEDISGLASATAEYRVAGSSGIRQLALTQISGTAQYSFEIAGGIAGKRGLEYRVIATDSLGNVSTGPVLNNNCNSADTWIPVQTRIEGEGDFPVDRDDLPAPLLFGGEQSSYQLFSVPYEIDQNDILSVLADDLGKYKKSSWRILDYKPDNPEEERYLEGENARPFIPGRSYFLITSRENIVVDSGPVLTRKTACPDSIRLYQGWNLIATPFNFPVSEDALSLVNSGSPIVLQDYDLGWREADAMLPWKGYALFVTADSLDDPIYLVVQPIAATGLSKTAKTAFGENDWQIQISGRAGKLHDTENWLGVRENASEGFDQWERPEPPVVGDYLKIMVPHENWQQPTKEFSTDFRPVSGDEISWDFEVHTNNAESVELTFDFQGNLPVNREIYLIDEAYGLSQNLKNTPVYGFNAGSKQLSKKLRILVGSLDYVRRHAGAVELLPQTFELFQNFPNPFNPETTIRFDLPTTSAVTLEIFDLLGRKVVTLIDGENRAPGFYRVAWSGKDKEGYRVASGVYIYRLKAEGHTFTRKMILLK